MGVLGSRCRKGAGAGREGVVKCTKRKLFVTRNFIFPKKIFTKTFFQGGAAKV